MRLLCACAVAWTGMAWTVEARTGDAQSRTGEARTGEARTGEARTGKARTGEAQTGQARTGQTAAGKLDERSAIQAERQWHAGVDVGYALGSFELGDVSGFLAGIHLAYGVSDAFNLRLHVDMSAFDLPAPATSAFVYHAAIGAEYLVDVLDWVPYLGLVSGPSLVVIADVGQAWNVSIEPLIGLGYRLSRHITVGAEVRYRILFLQQHESVPVAELLPMGRFEYTWLY